MKKDILFLCQFFYPEYNSSATLPFDTAKYLASQNFSVGVLCGYPKEYTKAHKVPKKEVIDSVEIQRIKYLQLKRGSFLGRLINYFSFTLKSLLHIGKLRHYEYVIVYSNPPILPLVTIIANILFNTKIIFVSYDVYPEVAYASNTLNPNSFISKIMVIQNHNLFKRVFKVVALTDEMKNFLLDNRKELSEDKVITIPNWAHENLIAPNEEAYMRFAYQKNQFIVSYFGNMGTCQDMNTLLDAAEKLKNNEKIKFLFVGHGNKFEIIKERIECNQLNNIQLLSFLTGKDFEQAVAISSCCVVSLEKGLKGTCAPSKYYSYLQAGKPIIAIVEKDSYIDKEILNREIGASVENGDSESLTEKLVEFSKIDLTDISVKVKTLYNNHYSFQIAMQKYKSIFNK